LARRQTLTHPSFGGKRAHTEPSGRQEDRARHLRHQDNAQVQAQLAADIVDGSRIVNGNLNLHLAPGAIACRVPDDVELRNGVRS
jgi:hypothetical protein